MKQQQIVKDDRKKKPYTNFEQHRAALHLNVILDLFQLITNEKKQSKKNY